MVKITNGVQTFEVTRGAFEGIYKYQGFRVVNSKKSSPPKEPEKTIEDQIAEILEVPLANWGTNQLKLFTEYHKIDTTGCKKAAEVRAKVKEFLDSQAQNDGSNDGTPEE